MKIKVIHGGDFRYHWEGIYAKFEDYEGVLNYCDEDEFQDELFKLFESGFEYNSEIHEIVE